MWTCWVMGRGRRLVFEVNGVEDRGALDRVVGERDELVVSYE